MINAVLFDLDNTLIDRDSAFCACVRSQFSDIAVQTEILALDQNGGGDRVTLFRLWEERCGEKMNQSLLGQLIAGRISPDPSLLAELKGLSNRTKIGLISNGSSETQRRKLKAAGLDAVFARDHVWISEEVGWAKPHAKIFEGAASFLSEAPENCLYIGDRHDHDLCGASGAGMRARLVASVLSGPQLRNLLQEVGK